MQVTSRWRKYFFELNKKLAQLMSNQTSYTVSLEGNTSYFKKDAPSGTAISFTEQIFAQNITKTK
ncbi:MAG: hypothetical protein IPP48_10925 [Chitinophagaceae bacterium]|nr:hypothetical protein [Chitinophagaceae bacterium]